MAEIKHEEIGIRFGFQEYHCFDPRTRDLIAEEGRKRGEVHLSFCTIDGVVFPFIQETGQMLTGVRSASLKSSYDEVTTIDMNVILYKPATEDTEDGDS